MEDYKKYMRKAIELAKKGEGKVNPNPIVGAIIVKDEEIIGSGYHKKYGGNHAERNAIKNAIKNVQGSTIYVTLEPCFHFGKTPPCVDLIIEKKFKKVVIGMVDPNPLVSGKSIEKLKRNGIEVIYGIMENECKALNEAFIKYIRCKLPYVVLKAGMSIDGKIATNSGESKWITSREARKDAYKLRNKMSAIMVGINTIIHDNPRLTCRIKNSIDPYRIIVDSNLRIPMESNIIKNKDRKTIIATISGCNKEKKNELMDLGIQLIEVEEKNKRVNLTKLMSILGEMKIDSILLEGGGELNFSAIEEGIVDKVKFYIAPKIIGGKNSKNAVSGKGFSSLEDVVSLNRTETRFVGDDIIFEGYIKK